MQVLPSILGPEAMGWAAALLTLLTFVSADIRRLRLLALTANATFIAYGATAELLPVLALHLALVPVNLWRLNQAFRHPVPFRQMQRAPAKRSARQPRGWTPGLRVARSSRSKAGSANRVARQGSDQRTAVASARNGGEPMLT